MQQDIQTLNDVQYQFRLWRASKKSGECIPDVLWALVKQLLKSGGCRRSVVGRELGISTSQLRKRFPDFYKTRPPRKINAPTQSKTLKERPHHRPNFVSVPVPTHAITGTSSAQLTLLRQDGAKLCLSVPSTEQCTSVVKLFLE